MAHPDVLQYVSKKIPRRQTDFFPEHFVTGVVRALANSDYGFPAGDLAYRQRIR